MKASKAIAKGKVPSGLVEELIHLIEKYGDLNLVIDKSSTFYNDVQKVAWTDIKGVRHEEFEVYESTAHIYA